MAHSVRCPNPDCPEVGVNKITATNAQPAPTHDIHCGYCATVCEPGDDVPIPDYLLALGVTETTT